MLSHFDAIAPFLNPFNFIVEHPLKDIVLLYQNDYLTFEELTTLLKNYKFDVASATFFMARMLYRVDVFDFLETKRELDEKDQQLKFNLEKEMHKIKKVYHLLKHEYSIRPIEWLEGSL